MTTITGSELCPLAVEVPLAINTDDSTPVTIHVDTQGREPIYQFPAATCAGSSLSTAHDLSSSSRTGCRILIWQTEASDPQLLTLRDFGLIGKDSQEDIARCNFTIPILPSVADMTDTNGEHLFVITADGYLHVISVTVNVEGGNTIARQLASLPSSLGGIRSIDLNPAFQRLGAAACMTCVRKTLCIGTVDGTVLCLSASEPDVEDAFELNPSNGLLGGLSGIIGSIFAPAAPKRVEQLAQLTFLGKSYLCSVQSGSTLRIWDVAARRLLHSCELLPPEAAAAHRASVLRIGLEPLDASTSILLVFFEPIDPTSTEAGHLCTYEAILEDRGGAVKVHIESGPRLEGAMHRLKDLTLQHTDERGVVAWLLYDDTHGERHVACLPVTFGAGEVQGPGNVVLLEEQIRHGTRTSDPVDRVAFNTFHSLLEMLTKSTKPSTADGILNEACAHSVLAAGRYSKPVLLEAMESIGVEHPHDVLAHSQVNMIAALKAAIASGTDNDEECTTTDGIVARWSALIEAYANTLRSRHMPFALLQVQEFQGEEGLLLLRGGGAVSTVMMASASELFSSGNLPKLWSSEQASVAKGTLQAVMKAAHAVTAACGGAPFVKILRASAMNSSDVCGELLPAVVSVLTTGQARVSSPLDKFEEENGGYFASWRARCRSLPLLLGSVLASAGNGESAADGIESVVNLLSQEYSSVIQAARRRSGLTTFSQPLATATLARAHQIASAHLDCLLQVGLLAAICCSVQSLGTWACPGGVYTRLLEASGFTLEHSLSSAKVAYWTTSAPSILKPAVIDQTVATDAAAMVVTLRLGDSAPASSAAKRARLSPIIDRNATHAYAAESLLSVFQIDGAHAVRSLWDVQSVAVGFANWLLGSSQVTSLEPLHPPSSAKSLQRVLDLAASLLRTRNYPGLASMLDMLASQTLEDSRLVFFMGCSKAAAARYAGSPQEREEMENQAATLLFQVAMLYPHHAYFREQLGAVGMALPALQSVDAHAEASSAGLESTTSDELYYYESVIEMFERLGCIRAASGFALAAARHVQASLPGEDNAESRVRHVGRLWSSVFTFCLEARQWDEAYAALLGNESAEMQVDCVHRLVNELCERGEIATLCSLPFAHTALVIHAGKPAWVSLLDEAITALHRRAANLDLKTDPQPYKVLFDFYTARSNHQAAASAMLAYARRLHCEQPGDVQAAKEIVSALTIAVSSLGLVPEEQAWIQNPMGMSVHSFPAGAGDRDPPVGGDVCSIEDSGPCVLTLSDLLREKAIACARAALIEMMRAPEIHGMLQPEDIFNELLARGLHEDALALTDSAFLGTKQQRLRERAIYALSSHCARLQLQKTGVARTSFDPTTFTDKAPGPDNGAANGLHGDDMIMQMNKTTSNEDKGQQESPVAVLSGNLALYTTAAAGSSAGAQHHWKLLRRLLEAYERDDALGFHLRLMAVEAILKANHSLRPPMWLVAPFMPHGSAAAAPAIEGRVVASADTAGLLRAYMRHDRFEDAANIAIRYLNRLKEHVPSITMPRPASICLPHALLQELLDRLPGEVHIVQELTNCLNEVGEMVSRQTYVLEDIYAT